MTDLSLALMTGIDIPVPECQLTIHQPTLKEISLIGEQDFLIGVQCLCIDKYTQKIQDKSLLDSINNFQLFMRLMQDPEAQDKKQIVESIFVLLIPEKTVNFLPRTLVFIDKETKLASAVDENNFEALQKVLKCIFCSKETQTDFNPQGQQAEEIADKLKKARQRVAAQKGASSKSVFSQYISVLTVGLNSMNLEDCSNLTMYQLFDLIERYMLYTNWDMNIRSRLAGAKVDNQPENWMKPIH